MRQGPDLPLRLVSLFFSSSLTPTLELIVMDHLRSPSRVDPSMTDLLGGVANVDIPAVALSVQKSALLIIDHIELLVSPILETIRDHLITSTSAICTLSAAQTIFMIVIAHLLAALICLLHLTSADTILPTSAELNKSTIFKKKEKRSRAMMTPPHILLLNHLHPMTSLWPPSYLRAFERAERGDGVVRLDEKVVERDLSEGVVALRCGAVGGV